MESIQTSPILSDRPALTDALDFAPYRETLHEIISDPATDTPLTIGIFGTWGSGKTSLMKMLAQGLDTSLFRVIWFDAWKYDKDYSLWRAFLLRILDNLRPAKKETKQDQNLAVRIERLEEGLYRDVEWEEKGSLSVNWSEMAKGVAGGAVQLSFALIPGFGVLQKAVEAAQSTLGKGEIVDDAAGLVKAFRRDAVEHFQAQLRFVEQFQREFADLVNQHIVQDGQRLVVFVDDLDRCLPEKAIEVLEAIKVFMDVTGCIFVVGLDQEVIAQGIQVRYHALGDADEASNSASSFIDGGKYVEKIIQLPFILPPIEAQMMENLVKSLAPTLPDLRCISVFASGLAQVPNPRQVKRTLNVFLLLWRLAQKRTKGSDVPVSSVRLAKVVAIQSGHPDLYELFRHDPTYVRNLEVYFRKLSDSEKEELSPPAISPALQAFTRRPSLQHLLMLHADDKDACFSELTVDQLKPYLTLVSRTSTEVATLRQTAIETRRLGQYEVLEEIGKGGFAVVYKARDVQLGDRLVALKVIDPHLIWQRDSASRFSNSVKVWANLDHPNIVKVYDFGEYDGNLAVSMQFSDGPSLRELLHQHGKLSWEQSTLFAGQVASALDYAHSHGVAHLDVKPGNILTTSSGQALLTDFGLAEVFSASGESILTVASGFFKGVTPVYMAPEQIQGEPVSSATDVYALAEVFYEMITGETLFAAGGMLTIIRNKMDKPLSLPSFWPDDAPQDIDTILTKALAKEPSERYQSAGEFVHALQSLKTQNGTTQVEE